MEDFQQFSKQKPRTLDWGLRPPFFIEIARLVSGPAELQVLYVLVQKEFSKRQSDKLKVDLLREIHTPPDRVWTISEDQKLQHKDC